jgi:hypothetical protein
MKIPKRIMFRLVASISCVGEHRLSYRSDRWRCNAVVITPRSGPPGGPGDFGTPRTEYLIDGSKCRFKTMAALRKALARRGGHK